MSNIFNQITQAAAKQQEELARLRVQQEADHTPNSESPTPAEKTDSEDKNPRKQNNSRSKPKKTAKSVKKRRSGVSASIDTNTDDMYPLFTKPRRVPRRYSFNIYEDQIESLNKLQKTAKLKTGTKLDKSHIIRAGIDMILSEIESELEG